MYLRFLLALCVAEVIDTGQKAAGKPKDRQPFNGDITRDGQCESELTLP